MKHLNINGIRATEEGEGDRCVIFAPPHPLMGGNRHDPRLTRISSRLAEAGYRCLRFDYRKPYRYGTGEIKDGREILEFLKQGTSEIAVVGYSFGSLVASNIASNADLAVFISPLKKIDNMEFNFDIEVPSLVVYAIRDQIVDMTESIEIIMKLKNIKRFVSIETDHFYTGRSRELVQAVTDFISEYL